MNQNEYLNYLIRNSYLERANKLQDGIIKYKIIVLK